MPRRSFTPAYKILWQKEGKRRKKMSKYAFGVDIGGTTVKLGLFDREGCVLDKWEIPTVKDNGGAAILPDVAQSILAKLKEKSIRVEEIAGIGVGVPGAVDDKGTVVNGAVNLGWEVLNVPEVLQHYLDVPVKAANDANVAAFGEMWQGGGKGYTDMVAVTLGTGVGGGIISGGRILTGATGAGGEIGHMHVEDEEQESCGCKNKGCLEQYASAMGIARLARRRLARDEEASVLRGADITAKTVFDAVKAGDKVAIEIAEQFGEYLGKGLATVAAVVNPQVFVIGGGVSKAGEVLISYVEPVFQKYAFVACKGAKFALATLGNDAGIYGAAGLILREES
jgi:glucokinase